MEVQDLIKHGQSLDATMGRPYLVGTARTIRFSRTSANNAEIYLKPGSKIVYMKQFVNRIGDIHATFYYRRINKDYTTIVRSYRTSWNMSRFVPPRIESANNRLLEIINKQYGSLIAYAKNPKPILVFESNIETKEFNKLLIGFNWSFDGASSWNSSRALPELIRVNGELFNRLGPLKISKTIIQLDKNKKLFSHAKKPFIIKYLFKHKIKMV